MFEGIRSAARGLTFAGDLKFQQLQIIVNFIIMALNQKN